MEQQNEIKEESEQGRWMTVLVSQDELNEILNVKSQWENLGLSLPYTKILRQIVSRGFELIDWNHVQQNPMALFKEGSVCQSK